MQRSWRTLAWLCLATLVVCGPLIRVATAQTAPVLPEGFSLRQFQDSAGTHNYSVFIPRSQPPVSGWPVILFLHGAGQRGADGLLPLSNALACAIESRRSTGQEWPFITVFPQCEDVNGRALTGWVAETPDAKRALHILAEVERTERVDAKRRILAGWSMGGYGAWSLAAAKPELWSRVLVVSGGAQPKSLTLEDLGRGSTSLWAIHGETDPLIPAAQSDELVRELNRLGGRGRYTMVPGVGHDVWRNVLGDIRILNWLSSTEAGEIPDLAGKEFTVGALLPSRSRFFLTQLAQPHTLRNTVAAQLGSADLGLLSSVLREEILRRPAALQASLPDIQRSFGSEETPLSATLAGLKYSVSLHDVRLKAISGGRLGVCLEFRPLRFDIGRTELSSGEHWARTGPLRIEFGEHRPARLQLELQPQSTENGLRLHLLRQEFHCGDDNWYIVPPEDIEVRSPTYTAWHISTGLVGSLYLAHDEIVAEILKTVPGLVRTLEENIRAVDAPQLARLLSPLPVVTPELRLAPQRLCITQDGVSALFDVQVLTQRQPGITNLERPMSTVMSIGQQGPVVEIALDAIAELSRLNIQQELMRVNVLDVSDSRFAELTHVPPMSRVLPGGIPPETVSLRTVLRLLEPLRVTPGTTNGAAPNSAAMVLSTPGAALEVWSETGSGARRPMGRIVFLLKQPVSVELPDPATGQLAAQSVAIRWSQECEVQFLRCESLEESHIPAVDAAAFENLFKEAWQSWARDNGSRAIEIAGAAGSGPAVSLREIQVDDRRIRLEFGR